MNARQQINKQILETLLQMNETFPDQRFGQLLVNCGVTVNTAEKGWPINEISYHEESHKILERMLRTLQTLASK